MPRVFGIGETVLDILFKHDQPRAAVPGGSTFNAIISLGRAGVDCCIVTEVGDDHVGDITCQYLRDNGVSDRFVARRKGVKSHVSLAFLNEQNDAQYIFYKDHAGVRIEAQQLGITAEDALLFGSFFAVNPQIRPAVLQMLTEAHDAGALLYYDVNFRKPHLADLPQVYASILENMSLATVVRGSTEDFALLFGADNAQAPNIGAADLLSADSALVEQAVDRLYTELISRYCPYFICTSGSGAVYLRTPSNSLRIPVPQLPTVSTVGAGDNFNAGFLYSLLSHPSPQSISHDSFLLAITQGLAFAQNVCQSLDNSVSRAFASSLRR